MAAIIGSATEARNMAKELLVCSKNISENIQGIVSKKGALESSFQDAGFDEVDEIVNQVYSVLSSHIEDIGEFVSVLKDYAELLETK